MKLLRIPFLLLVFSFLTFAQPQKDTTVSDSYQSGLEKIKSIMLDGQEGIPADYEQNPDDYAQTRNLDQDLNIDEIVKFFGCSTSMCETYLKQAFEHPFSQQGKERMLQRQRIIRALVENPELKAKVDELVAQAKTNESDVAKLFSEGFKGEHCPSLEKIDQIKKHNPADAARKCDEGIKSNNYYFTRRLALAAMNLGYESIMLYFGLTTGLLQGLVVPPELKVKALALIANVVYHLPNYFVARSFYLDYNSAAKKRSLIVALNHMITLSEEIETLGKEYNFRPQCSSHNIVRPEAAQKFIDDLKSDRYADKDTRLFTPQFVHNILYTIYKYEEHLAKTFAVIGELDALNAIATKIIEHKDKDNSFCFSEIIESEKPMIEAENFWNALVENPVANNIKEDKNIILTGPNAGGKSTAIRALLQNAVFTQFGGFAAGKKFKATFFDIIHSYLNISDDLKNGLSLFASEVKRAQEVKEVVKSIEVSHKKFLCALDELFTGTAGEAGEECAYEYIKRLFTSRHMLCIYATHFDKLKKLEQESNNNCSNYKINAPIEDAQGNFKYPYTLDKGINNTQVGIEMARKAGLFD